MIDDEQSKLQATLESLGLNSETAGIYLYLIKNGHSSALNISSKTGISRTQVYRYLCQLTKLNLVSEEKPYWGTYFYALPISNLQTEINNQKQKLKSVELQLKGAETLFADLFQNQDSYEVVTYKGISGLKQALWNITKAEGEYRVFEVDHVSNLIDAKFSRSLRQKQMDNRVKSFDLSNKNEHIQSEMEPIDLNLSKVRYISPDILKIKFEIIVYNNQVTLIDYFGNEPIALEFKNKYFNLMMNQMFTSFWSMSEDVNWVD